MELRRVLYGYSKEQFKYYIVPEEAKIVRSIYKDYLMGYTLQVIANRLTENKVVFFKDKTVWSKNAVCRVLDNKHYIGDEEYPAILDEETYEKAMKIRMDKGGSREKDSREVEYFKNHTVCEQCGSRFTRRSKYKIRERWLCTNGCPSTTEYLDDSTFFSKVRLVLDEVRKNPGKVMYVSEMAPSQPTREVAIKELQIKQLISDSKSMFQPIKKLIIDSLIEKYDYLNFDPSKEITDELCEFLKNYKKNKDSLDISFMKMVISKIIVQRDGDIKIRFVNGKEISNRQVVDDE